MGDRLTLDSDALAQLCRRHRIRKLSLFGSVLRGTARQDSDVDLLVEFEPGQKPGLIGMANLEVELSDFEKQQMRDDASWLNRMTDEKLRFEVPDTSDGNATMQAQPTPAITIKTRNFTERTMDGV